ncbi:MAG: cation diffusion facilitator family transporter [Alphaproteobacteria bacterium]|jgi:ferrous-iron efflux pump FieF|nr:cation diffusion facilitator family transporter [Alphaproteobacteria bacterium]MBT5916943.1 cation diffusion facilitator family transporter [Alphaproteobacteria bacterium]
MSAGPENISHRDEPVPIGGTGGVDPKSARLMKLATYASVAVASLLIVIKAWAWLKSDSVALLSSLVDSILDALASIVNLVAVRHALEPADAEHRFGHGKVESLASLAQAAFIGGSSVFLVFQAIERFIHPQPVENSILGILVMLASMALTLVLVLFQRHVVNKTGSVAVSADSLHYRSDLLVNAGVILALVAITVFDWRIVDPLVAVLVAVYIFHGAWEIFRQSYDMLMDREFPVEDREKILAIVLAHEDVHSLHDLRTRSSGINSFIQLHVEVDGDMPLTKAHEIADELEISIGEAFPGADVIIHQDPHGI